MPSAADALGFAAALLTTFAFVPQVVRIVRTRSAHDISWWMFGVFSLGVALWLGDGIMTGALPVILANGVTLALALSILVLKWRFGRDPPRSHDGAEDTSGV
jgi:MtN3 and saliva related transmembrane protein